MIISLHNLQQEKVSLSTPRKLENTQFNDETRFIAPSASDSWKAYRLGAQYKASEITSTFLMKFSNHKTTQTTELKEPFNHKELDSFGIYLLLKIERFLISSMKIGVCQWQYDGDNSHSFGWLSKILSIKNRFLSNFTKLYHSHIFTLSCCVFFRVLYTRVYSIFSLNNLKDYKIDSAKANSPIYISQPETCTFIMKWFHHKKEIYYWASLKN